MDDQALKTLPQIIEEHTKPVVEMIIGNDQFIVVPKNMSLQSLKDIRDENRLTPAYREDSVTTKNVHSFIDHIKRFVSPNSVMFAKQPAISGNSVDFSMTTVIDHHPAGTDVTVTGGKKHTIKYQASTHARMTKWIGGEKRAMTQKDFATFIEDNIGDLAVIEFTPPFGGKVGSPAELLTLSRGLEVRVNHTVQNAVRLATGETSLVFVTENKTTKDNTEVIVPEWFGVKLPIFVGTEPIVLPVRLRYKVEAEGQINFTYLFYQFDQILESMVNSMIHEVRDALPDLHVVEGIA